MSEAIGVMDALGATFRAITSNGATLEKGAC